MLNNNKTVYPGNQLTQTALLREEYYNSRRTLCDKQQKRKTNIINVI